MFFTPAQARAIAVFFAVCAFYGVLLYLRPESAFPHVSAAGSVSTDPDLKIAFLADQGLGADAEAVLGIVKAEGAAAVVHAGDFDYAHRSTHKLKKFYKAQFPILDLSGITMMVNGPRQMVDMLEYLQKEVGHFVLANGAYWQVVGFGGCIFWSLGLALRQGVMIQLS